VPKTCTIVQISVKNTKIWWRHRGLNLDRTSHTKLNTSSLIAMEFIIFETAKTQVKSLGAKFIRTINYNIVHGMLGL